MDAASRYQEALDYLYSFIDYSLERSDRYSADAFDLARVRGLLGALGDPQSAYPTLHVAGTKGKGSVSALLESCLRQAGFRTGFYTSPHLVRFAERIRVEGREIADADLVERVEEIRPHVSAVPGLTTYEIVTALAFLHFAREEVEVAVIEVGLGGRLDASNVITPQVSVITSLSYDHTHLLGGRLAEIAREKAGIIKPGVPLVLAPQQSEAEAVIRQIAAERGAPLVQVGMDWRYAAAGRDLRGQRLQIWANSEQPRMDAFLEAGDGAGWTPGRFEIPLLGYHQVVNAAVAYGALQSLQGSALEVSEDAIREGFRKVAWPGRFQVLSENPAVVIDSAHNRESALRLRIALDDYFPGRPVTLIFGASEDKDVEGMMRELLPRVRRLLVTQAVHPRATDPAELAQRARDHGHRAEVVVPVAKALQWAWHAAEAHEVVLTAGSLFVAGEALTAWSSIPSAAPVPQGRL